MFGVNLGSGIIAGFAAAILSQPADTLLSQVSLLLALSVNLVCIEIEI